MRFPAFLFSALVWASAALTSAAPIDFDFKDPKSVNAMYFLLDSEVEPIMGLASGITGTVSFDPAEPKKLSGKILVAAESLRTDNTEMNKVLHGDDWMKVKENTEISFTFQEVKESKSTGDNQWELSVSGEFLCKGVKKAMTIPVRATYQKGGLANRMRGQKGDLLILRTEFKINRKDFGIKPEMGNTVVAEEIQIRAAIVGAHAEK